MCSMGILHALAGGPCMVSLQSKANHMEQIELTYTKSILRHSSFFIAFGPYARQARAPNFRTLKLSLIVSLLTIQ